MNLSEQLGARLEALGKTLGAREAAHREDLAVARHRAEELHQEVAAGIDRFGDAVRAAGAPDLGIEISSPKLDDKHIRSIEFDLKRGRHGAIITVKSKGEVTLVGPFRIGKAEGPCQSFPIAPSAEFDAALVCFLESFLEAVMSP